MFVFSLQYTMSIIKQLQYTNNSILTQGRPLRVRYARSRLALTSHTFYYKKYFSFNYTSHNLTRRQMMTDIIQ